MSLFTRKSNVFKVRQAELVDTIKRLYAWLIKKNLPIFVFNTKDLSEQLTSVWDARYEISRMPSWVYWIWSERVLEDNESGDDDDDD